MMEFNQEFCPISKNVKINQIGPPVEHWRLALRYGSAFKGLANLKHVLGRVNPEFGGEFKNVNFDQIKAFFGPLLDSKTSADLAK